MKKFFLTKDKFDDYSIKLWAEKPMDIVGVFKGDEYRYIMLPRSDFPELTYKNSPIEIELSTFKYNMSSPSEENFLNKIKECSKQNYIINPNIFLSDHDFVNIIIEHFLGKNWYVCSSISNVQVNAEAMLEILDKYPNINGNRIGKTFFLKRYFRKLWNSLKKNYKK